MNDYPSATDYMRALQDPRNSFTVEALRTATFPVHPTLGTPLVASGSSAVVVKSIIGGREQALRFFTRNDVSTRARYKAMNDHFERHGIASHMATSVWLDDAIRVNGRTWPTVQMEWVNGRTLDAYVDDLVDDGDLDTLTGLVPVWRNMVRSLQSSGFAHGDLQHGNVLVDHTGQLRLVDFDCCWLDSFAAQTAPTESGHRNYQRSDAVWGKWMDTFPALVVHTSLLAVAHKPSLWSEMHNGENLIFESKDFGPPYNGRVWREIHAINDQRLTTAANRLRQCCERTWEPGDGLDTLLQVNWWEQAQRGVPAAMVETPPIVIPQLKLPKEKPNLRAPNTADRMSPRDGSKTKMGTGTWNFSKPSGKATTGAPVRSTPTPTGAQWWQSNQVRPGTPPGSRPQVPAPPPNDGDKAAKVALIVTLAFVLFVLLVVLLAAL